MGDSNMAASTYGLVNSVSRDKQDAIVMKLRKRLMENTTSGSLKVMHGKGFTAKNMSPYTVAKKQAFLQSEYMTNPVATSQPTLGRDLGLIGKNLHNSQHASRSMLRNQLDSTLRVVCQNKYIKADYEHERTKSLLQYAQNQKETPYDTDPDELLGSSTAEHYLQKFMMSSQQSFKEPVLSRDEKRSSKHVSPLLSTVGKFETIPEVFSSKIQSMTASNRISTRQSPRE